MSFFVSDINVERVEMRSWNGDDDSYHLTLNYFDMLWIFFGSSSSSLQPRASTSTELCSGVPLPKETFNVSALCFVGVGGCVPKPLQMESFSVLSETAEKPPRKKKGEKSNNLGLNIWEKRRQKKKRKPHGAKPRQRKSSNMCPLESKVSISRVLQPFLSIASPQNGGNQPGPALPWKNVFTWKAPKIGI